jgi:hypothetical protein
MEYAIYFVIGFFIPDVVRFIFWAWKQSTEVRRTWFSTWFPQNNREPYAPGEKPGWFDSWFRR